MHLISPQMEKNDGRIILKVGKYVYSGKTEAPLGIPIKTLRINFLLN